MSFNIEQIYIVYEAVNITVYVANFVFYPLYFPNSFISIINNILFRVTRYASVQN